MTTAVYLECGSRRVFACALDWPGWCRSGKTEEGALETLAAYAPRYAVVTKEAGVRFSAPAAATTFDVVERLPGDAGTDFGVPGAIASGDGRRLTPTQLKMVEASWRVFDRVAAGAPEALRKGPRGGGRDRDAIVDHVANAEAAYARKLGMRERPVTRQAIVQRLRTPTDDASWPPRCAARRIAWHVLDHAWEIEDKSA